MKAIDDAVKRFQGIQNIADSHSPELKPISLVKDLGIIFSTCANGIAELEEANEVVKGLREDRDGWRDKYQSLAGGLRKVLEDYT